MKSILVINAGSSSVKFRVFETDGVEKLTQLIKGEFDGIGTKPRLRARNVDDVTLIDQVYYSDSVPNIASAMQVAGAWLRDSQKLDLVAVGHRVVHGGPEFIGPTFVDHGVLARLTRYN